MAYEKPILTDDNNIEPLGVGAVAANVFWMANAIYTVNGMFTANAIAEYNVAAEYNVSVVSK